MAAGHWISKRGLPLEMAGTGLVRRNQTIVMKMPRRDFLKAAPVAAYAMTQIAKGAIVKAPTASAQIKIEPFDYRGVKLRESLWQKRYQAVRDFYFGVSDDDILQ